MKQKQYQIHLFYPDGEYATHYKLIRWKDGESAFGIAGNDDAEEDRSLTPQECLARVREWNPNSVCKLMEREVPEWSEVQ